MPEIIKDGKIISDDWLLVMDSDQLQDTRSSNQPIFIAYDLWQDCKQELDNRRQVGVVLNPDQPANLIAEDLSRLAAVAVNVTAFMDGRGFSYARELRETLKFRGEIRVIGHFMRDQLFYFQRCGANAFQFADETDLSAALASLTDFSDAYQASADKAEPLFLRR